MCKSTNYLHPLEEGHEVDSQQSPVLETFSVLPTLGRTFRPVQRKNSATEKKIKII
jgi:hypothetical protein